MSGGTMECANPERGFTIYHTNANGGLVLSGNPTIIGRIMGDRGRLSVLPGFEPSEDTIYRMHYTSFTSGVVVAGNAGNFPGNFTINNSDFILMASGADLIMKSVLDYSYTRAGSTYTIFQIAGGEYLTMQSVIEAIKEEAGSAPCTIRFGNDSVVNIVSETVRLDNASGTWGTITLQGQISSINVAANQGTVTIADDVSVHSQADIANTGTGRAISHTGTGTVTISDGTVSAATGQAIFNNGTGTVNVSGGTVSAVTGRAIENTNTGRINISGTAIVTSGNASESVAGVNTAGTILISGTQAAGTRLEISGNAVVRNTGSTDMSRAIYNSSTNGVISITGGTVSAAAGRAIENANTGRITISGTALVTSENVSSSSGTVFISGTQAAGTRLEINGGTVRNTSTVANGNVVYNTSTNGAVHISGGTVSTTATNGFALQQTNANAQLVLGGNPQISGTAGIRVPVGRLTVSTSANPVGDVPAFAPSVGRTYQLNFSSYSLDMIAVQNGGAFRNNFVLLNLRLDWGTIVDNGNLVVAAYNAFDYVRNGTTYTVTRSLSSSFANIQEVINAIRTAAGGTACTIQFGDENFNLLGIDANPVLFDGAWGIITLRGKITSSSSQGTIMFADNVSVNSEADIANTGSNSNGIVNNGTGTISIISGIITSSSGAILNNVAGTISVLGGTITSISPSNNSIVISNTGAGTINVSGGTITSASVTFSSAISNSGTGTINVSGGTVLGMSSASWAIRNTGTGTVYISGTADVASSNANGAWGGTISISIAQAAGTRLVISGGTVRNTSTTADGDAIYNNSTNGAVHITGGTISTTAANGFAIQHTEPNTQLVLGGNPDISGGLGIRVLAGRLSVATPANPVSGVPAFTPSAGRNYSLNYPSYTHNMVVVANGGIFRNFFTIYNQPYIELAFSDNNLIAKMNDYTFTKDGTTYIITETDEPGYSSIQTLINAIRTDADGQDCTIQFGSDGNVLNIHWSSISFNGSWGTVTLLGKITSLNAVGTEGTIVAAGVSINSQADITNASNNGRAINNTGTGTVTVSGGTVSCGTNASGNGIAILNAAAGEIIISGGTVMSNTGTNGGTISNSGAGTVTISEGTVSSGTSMTIANENVGAIIIDGGTVSSNADRGRTIVNTNAGTVSISGTAVVTSLNTNGFEGTINVSGTQAAGIRLEISGNAVVSNMAGGNTIYNSSGNGAVHINGGTVSTVSASGYAIRNTATNTMLVLDNSPAISGMILVMSTASAGRLSLGDSFVPNGTYTLEFSGTLTNIIAVVDGADFADSFELAASRQAAWKLEAEDGNLLVKSR
ncbi:MAG: hypothetical protein FWD36_02080 [Treponema sp.]|nr:hypothetical protein [Treponema sp.]